MPSIPRVSSTVYALAIWPWSHASIPSGWTRETDLDVKYLQGAATAWTPGGGAHSHTQTHTHTGSAHTHTIPASTSASAPVTFYVASGGWRVSGGTATHTHAGSTSAAGTVTYQNYAGSTTSVTADPPYTDVIFIKPDADKQDVPTNAVVLVEPSTAPPAGWNLCDGSSGTRDLGGRYLRGAAALGDGGGTGGAATHNHGGTLSHTHTPNVHSHPNQKCGDDSSYRDAQLDLTGSYTLQRKHHNVRMRLVAQAAPGSTGMTISAQSNDPAYFDLQAVQAQASAELAHGFVLPFRGSAADVAALDGWLLCDGTNGTPDLSARQIRCATGPPGGVGGENSHPHTLGAHTHVHSSGHNHPNETTGAADYFTRVYAGALSAKTYIRHTTTHTFNPATATPTLLSSGIFSSGAADKRAPYRTVLFIMSVGGATVLPGGVLAGGVLGPV